MRLFFFYYEKRIFEITFYAMFQIIFVELIMLMCDNYANIFNKVTCFFVQFLFRENDRNVESDFSIN